MLIYYIMLGIISLLDIVTFFLPTITSLPLGMDTYLIQFSSVVRALLDSLPFLTIPLATLALFYSLVFLRFGWTQIKWLVERVK